MAATAWVPRASDDFDRPDADPLVDAWNTFYSGDGGTRWAIVSRAVRPSSVFTNDVYAAWAPSGVSPFTRNHYSKAATSGIVGGTVNGTNGMAVVVRYSQDGSSHISTASTAESFYRLTINAAATGNLCLRRRRDGVSSTLANYTSAWAEGDVIELRVKGTYADTTLTVLKNGVELGTVTDPNGWDGSGLPGIGYSSTITAGSLLSWEGGDLVQTFALMDPAMQVDAYQPNPLRAFQVGYQAGQLVPTLDDLSLVTPLAWQPLGAQEEPIPMGVGQIAAFGDRTAFQETAFQQALAAFQIEHQFGDTDVVFRVNPLALATAEAWGNPNVISTGGFSGQLIYPAAIASLEAFGSADKVVRLLNEIGLASAEAWGSARVQRMIRNAGGISTAEAVGLANVVRLLRNAGAISSVEAFGAAAHVNRLLYPQGIASAEAFGGNAHLMRLLYPLAITTAEAFGVARPTRILRPVGIASSEAFGNLTILRIYGQGIASAVAFGIPNVVLLVKPVAIASAQAFGNARLFSLFVRAAGGISSAEAFGADNVRFVVQPTGIASAQGLGTPLLLFGAKLVSAVGQIASLEAFGSDSVRFIVKTIGLSSAEAFGIAHPTRNLRSTSGIASAEAFGQNDKLIRLLNEIGLTSLEAFGSTDAMRVIRNAGAIASAQALGTPDAMRVLKPVGLSSAEAFANPKLRRLVYEAGIASVEAWGLPRLPDYIIITEFDSVPGSVLVSDDTGFSVLIVDRQTFGALTGDDVLLSALLRDVPHSNVVVSEDVFGSINITDRRP